MIHLQIQFQRAAFLVYKNKGKINNFLKINNSLKSHPGQFLDIWSKFVKSFVILVLHFLL